MELWIYSLYSNTFITACESNKSFFFHTQSFSILYTLKLQIPPLLRSNQYSLYSEINFTRTYTCTTTRALHSSYFLILYSIPDPGFLYTSLYYLHVVLVSYPNFPPPSENPLPLSSAFKSPTFPTMRSSTHLESLDQYSLKQRL